MKRLRAFVSGKVQMTGYRARVVNLANFPGLVGFVQNLPDGRVKVVPEGEEPVLERFLHDLRINDPLIDVQDIEVDYTGAMGDFLRFEKNVGTGETDQRLDKAAELEPNYVKATAQKGGTLAIMGEYEEAIECLDQDLELDPDNFEAWFNKGSVLKALGKIMEGG